jgi:hypothetical protein
MLILHFFSSDLQVRIQEMRYYGSLEVDVFGFWGPVCDVDWDDHEVKTFYIILAVIKLTIQGTL